MSPIRAGSAKVAAISGEQLAARAQDLSTALTAGGAQLDPDRSARAKALVARVDERTAITGSHTVVALAGATGSGKSSLFNKLVGAGIAIVGARRPTTSTPTAGLWGDEPAHELLSWIDIDRRHEVRRTDTALDDRLDGLVLLDLPDFDSRETSHRLEAERILALADVFVWVTDPQKYADARLHDDFIAQLSAHGATTLVVLNQIDRLTPEAQQRCVADLVALCERDGLPNAQVLAVSALTGAGLDTLKERIANAIAGAGAARTRLAADLSASAKALSADVGAGEPTGWRDGRKDLVSSLSRAAGVPIVLEAVERDYLHDATGHTGWVFSRWTRHLRPDPLKRLRLAQKESPTGVVSAIDEADVRAVLGRSSLPPPSPASRAAVDLATRQLGDAASEGLPAPWADDIADAATRPDTSLADDLDQAIMHTSLRTRRPLWWKAFGALQILLGLAAAAGLVWLLALMVSGWLQLPLPAAPTQGVVPWPVLLLVGGLVLGLALAGLARWFAKRGARRRRATVDKRLRQAIGVVADERILAPVDEVLQRHQATREALARATGSTTRA